MKFKYNYVYGNARVKGGNMKPCDCNGKRGVRCGKRLQACVRFQNLEMA